MDVPVKVSVQGRDVFICCAGCEDMLKAEPDKFLAKLSPDPAK
jgi:Cu(I)/Ag(I) efflux system membrane fusion protein